MKIRTIILGRDSWALNQNINTTSWGPKIVHTDIFIYLITYYIIIIYIIY